jgi:hypothetical protein
VPVIVSVVGTRSVRGGAGGGAVGNAPVPVMVSVVATRSVRGGAGGGKVGNAPVPVIVNVIVRTAPPGVGGVLLDPPLLPPLAMTGTRDGRTGGRRLSTFGETVRFAATPSLHCAN